MRYENFKIGRVPILTLIGRSKRGLSRRFVTKDSLDSEWDFMNDFFQIDSGPKFCGKGLPPPYFKNSNSAQIRFKTNDNLSGKAIRGRNLSISF